MTRPRRKLSSASKREPRLPADHAIVVQVGVRVPPGSGHIEGRVEHLVSGTARHFESWEDLLRFIEDALGRISDGSS